ncbi:MAG: DUF4443 domain-containing protein [Candidatus Bathyarchaeia archaeon]
MSRGLKKLLEELACGRAPGPATTFSALHILRVIELVAERPVGRKKLAEELKVGPGAVRTIIGRLVKAGLLTTSKAGCGLTSRGLKLWKDYNGFFGGKFRMEKSCLMPESCTFAILIKNCGHKVKNGIEQRDAAVKVGAKSVTTITYKSGRFIIPSVSDDVARDFPNIINQLVNLFHPEDNDVIIIGGAESSDLAEYGAIAAAWTLLNDC